MPDYSLGKIYKIVGNGKVYVGSTTRPLLCQRMAEHRSRYKNWKNGKYQYATSFECFPDCYIELLEVYPCNSKDELYKCERKWIEELDCVNRNIPLQTRKEYRELNKQKTKEYYQKNKEHLQKKATDYYYKKKLLASNNNLPIDPTNLLIEVESQKANLIVEHE